MPDSLYKLDDDAVDRVYDALLRTIEGHPSNRPENTREFPLQTPDRQQFASLLDVAYRASLEREEGREIRFRAAFGGPDRALAEMPFECPVEYSVEALVKMAPALGDENFIAVSADASGLLSIWGIARPAGPVVMIEAVDPGTLALKVRPATAAFVGPDVIRVVAGAAPVVFSIVRDALSGASTPEDSTAMARLLCALAPLVRKAGHGGTVLAVPADSSGWAPLLELKYAVSPEADASGYVEAVDGRKPLAYYAALMGPVKGITPAWTADQADLLAWRSYEVARSYRRSLARLASVDGAVVIETTRRVRAFGARIRRKEPQTPIDVVPTIDPVTGDPAGDFDLMRRGTRHLSAAGFVADVDGSAALVVSQDGGVTFFFRKDGAVHAVRGAEASLV